MAAKRIASLITLIVLVTLNAYCIPDPSTAHIKVISVNDGLPDN